MNWVLSVLGAVLLSLAGWEAWGWLPRLSQMIILLETALLPKDRRQVRREEWIAELAAQYDERRVSGLLWTLKLCPISLWERATSLPDAPEKVNWGDMSAYQELRLAHPEADNEVAELARTLEGMLGALDSARANTEAMLDRNREFVAASHELGTPLASALANLELLAGELEGEQADTAQAALVSTWQTRRLVGDLLARADAARQ